MTSGKLFKYLGLLVLGGAVMSVAAPAAGGSARSQAAVKPVIGQPTSVPAQAVAGKPFAVSFKVTRSDNGKRLMTGRMVCDPSSAGKVISHTESFKGGTARLAFVVPATAAQVRVKVTIKAGPQSTTRISTFAVKQMAKPTLSIDDSSVMEGSAGTTTLAFPVMLSAPSGQAVTVAYATSDGTATAPGDYTAASGTLSFKPGETSSMVQVNVVGDTTYEPDETFTVTLSNPVNATVETGSATGTIQNDDPVAQPGHYQGMTSQNEAWNFDVTPDGRGVTHLTTGQINLSCNPATINIYGGGMTVTGTIPIAANGSFSASFTFTGTLGGTTPTQGTFTLAGQFANNTASGTFTKGSAFTYQGTAFECTSGNQSWNATRTG